MPFFDVPTAETIRQHSRLNLEQVWKSFASTNDLDAEIEVRRDRKANLVETKLLKVTTADAWDAADAEDLARRNDLASTWVELLTLASLYGSSGQFNPGYWKMADQYREEAREYELALLNELDALDGDVDNATGTPDSTSTSVVPVW
jgi:hypothetical protein